MTFKWLPDAELDPHPRLTWFAECCCDVALSALYRIEAIYPPDYRLAPGTLVLSNHQRDADVPILGPVLCRREGLRLNWPLPFFASREDLFRPDFLSEYLHSWPRPLQRLLLKLPLAWFFRVMRVEPLRRVREFTLAEAFSELTVGDDKVCWLNDRGRYEMAANDGDFPDVRGQSPARRAWGLRRLHGQARETLGPEFRATVDTHLERFVDLLDAGRVVYLAPEGRNSRNGRFGRIRAGAWELAQRAAAPPPILPVALSYDPLQSGRLRALVHVGTALDAYSTTSRGRFDDMLELAIRRLYPLNASHLISRFLVAGSETFTTDDFSRWLGHARDELTAAGFPLDPQLARGEVCALAAKRLGWLQRKALVEPTPAGWSNRWPHDALPGWRSPSAIVRYCDNALDDHLRALAPELNLSPC